MGKMKKISVLFLAFIVSIMSVSISAYAADGNISFTDPETAVGEMVEVRCAFRTNGANMKDLNMKINYDASALSFKSGDNVTKESDGVLAYTGTATSSEVLFSMNFQALKEGTSTISIESATVTSDAGTTLNMEYGSSAVAIGPGDPSKIEQEGTTGAPAAGDKQVDVSGTAYSLSDQFADADIPNGYVRTTVSLDGEERQMVLGEGNGVYLAYLISGEGKGDFFLYNTGNATFAPYEEVAISDTTAIVVLSDIGDVKLPDHYQEANLTLNGKDFPVWQDTINDGFYLIYAVNNTGETNFYRYDTAENTYQRYDVAPKEEAAPEEVVDNSLFGKIGGFINKYIKLVVPAAAALLLFLLILLLVIAVKLRNRNLELDDLYDEYGIDDEEDEPVRKQPEKKPSKPKKPARKYEDEDDFDEEEFDEAEFEDDDLSEEEYEDDSFDTLDLDEDVFEDKKLKTYDTRNLRQHTQKHDDSGLEELREALTEKDDSFDVDFIDLD